MIECICEISVYVILCLISILIARKQDIRHNNLIKIYGDVTKQIGAFKIPTISYGAILVMSFLFTFFNVFSTWISIGYGSDRQNYAYAFSGARSTYSVGLDFVFSCIKKLGGNIETAFYFTTFVSVFLTLMAYRISKRTNYLVLVLLLCNDWVFFSFTALKQAYACAFSCLFFVFSIEYKSKKGLILSVACAVIASLFHITGLILFPILFLVKIKDLSKRKTIVFLGLIFALFFKMQSIMLFLAGVIGNFFPIYAGKINQYFMNEESVGTSISSFTFIKYIPIYYVAILGVVNRKKYSHKITDYNKYLVISFFGACMVGYSMSSYWFSRFIDVFYFPVFAFYNLLNRKYNNKIIKMINDIIVYGGSVIVLLRRLILVFITWGGF